MPFMQFHELLLVVLTMPWSTSFPHTCKSSSLTNLSKRLSRNGPKKPFYTFQAVLIVLTGPCSASLSCANQDEYADTVTSYVSFLQTPAFPQRLSQSMQMTNPGSQRTSNTNSLPKMMLSRTVIKTSTKQLNMKLRRLSEEQNHSTEISLKNSSQHPIAMLCGRASSESPSINRNQHLLTMTPPSQLNWITSTADSTGRTPPKLQATLALRRLCPQTQIQSPTTSHDHGRLKISSQI